ncbi:MAG: hypothetical protein PQJ61_18020 [Spirochaetales bacterium]|uniref:Uncharacterized protein n=1 Tax=Candidatus Thalassospirochaeta sargassi TaxID=3119039 RepID=A0AAJ1MPZ6_9SPIO|nr:hypothetical protein [Spirochaetales bacterium]
MQTELFPRGNSSVTWMKQLATEEKQLYPVSNLADELNKRLTAVIISN